MFATLAVIGAGATVPHLPHPAVVHQREACQPVTVRPATRDAAETLIESGWVDPDGTRTVIYPAGCESSR